MKKFKLNDIVTLGENPIFMLRQEASRTRSVGRSVCRLVGRSVGRSVRVKTRAFQGVNLPNSRNDFGYVY